MRLALLRGWTHSGFNIRRSQRVPLRNREDPPSRFSRFSRFGGTSMERLAQYIIRNPFSVDKMQPNSSGESIIYRSGMNPMIQRNFEMFSPCELTFALLTPARSCRLSPFGQLIARITPCPAIARRATAEAHPGQKLPSRALLRVVFQ